MRRLIESGISGQFNVGDRVRMKIKDKSYSYPKWLKKSNYIEVTAVDGCGYFAVNDYTLDEDERRNFVKVTAVYK